MICIHFGDPYLAINEGVECCEEEHTEENLYSSLFYKLNPNKLYK